MVCLRCGYCCISLSVIIIRPESVKYDLFIEELAFEAFMHKPSGYACPNLAWDRVDKKAICLIHDYPWYKYTPCFSHSQIERSQNNYCRIGKHIVYDSNLENVKKLTEYSYYMEPITDENLFLEY